MADDFYSLKAFVSFGSLTNNAANVISPLGELSVRSRTFAKDRELFFGTTSTSPETSTEVTVFSSRDTSGDAVLPPAPISDLVLEISDWIYAESLDGNITSDAAAFETALNTEFGDRISQITVGTMVTDSTIWMPGVLTFFLESDVVFGGTAPVGYEDSRLRLWFADETFQQQYDEYFISFIPPFENMDDFFDAPAQVVQYLSAMQLPELTSKVAAAAGDSPYTILVSLDFKYYHLGNPIVKTSAFWTFVIWSDFGNNLDLIKLSLADWILANSAHDREEWVEILPDIFSTTEFVVTPLWNQYAIPNLSLDNAMYSPIVSFQDADEMMKKTAAGTGYTDAHVEEHMTFLSMPYKSLACIAVGGPDNRDEKFKLYDHVPDYLAVPTSSIDFNRMSMNARNWALKMFAMIKVAETMTEFSDIPAGMFRLKRKNSDDVEILYVAGSVNEVQYLVTAKSTLNEMFPPVDRTTSPLTMLPDPSVTLTTPEGSKRLQLNVSATGGTLPYVFSSISSDIVPGGTIDPDTGALDVTFQDFGTNHIDVTVADDNNFAITRTYTVISTDEA